MASPPLVNKTRRPVKAARAPLAGPATPPADPCAPGGRCEKCKTSGGIFHLPTCVSCLTRCGPGHGGVNPVGGGTSWSSIVGKLPRYLEVAGGGAIIVAGLVVLVVSATGGTPKVPGVSAFAGRGKVEPSTSRNVRYAARRRSESDAGAGDERMATARLSAAESLAVRRAAEARRARAEAKLTESYLPERKAGLRRTGQVERPRGRGPVASRPVRSGT